ncbi:MAG: acyltransferase family protein, partial [Pseudorhodoplanes sp.]
MKSPSAGPQRYEALDGLRGVAALAVCFFHIRWANHITEWNGIRHAFVFVDLFFMLSGFVLFNAYGAYITNRSRVVEFLTLRFFRIYPLHFAILMGLVLLEATKLLGELRGVVVPEHAAFSGQNSPGLLVVNLLLLQGFPFAGQLSWNTPSWSISCEAAGYVVFAAACFIGLVKRFAVGFWIAVAILSYVIVLAVKQSLDASYDLGLLRCLGGFCVGIAIAKFIRIESVASWFNACGERTMTLITGGIVLWIVVALSYVDGYSEAVLLPAFAALILVLHRDSGAVAGALKSAPLAFLGRVSYSVYMIHVPVLMVALSVLTRRLRTGQDSALKVNYPWLG